MDGDEGVTDGEEHAVFGARRSGDVMAEGVNGEDAEDADEARPNRAGSWPAQSLRW